MRSDAEPGSMGALSFRTSSPRYSFPFTYDIHRTFSTILLWKSMVVFSQS
jgi:hypothetical protein